MTDCDHNYTVSKIYNTFRQGIKWFFSCVLKCNTHGMKEPSHTLIMKSTSQNPQRVCTGMFAVMDSIEVADTKPTGVTDT